jgi:hypothetical protein
MVAVGLPSGPGTNSRLAIASPALKADSTAATAMDCQHDRGARRPQRPRRPRQQGWHRADEQQRNECEGQRGHAASLLSRWASR